MSKIRWTFPLVFLLMVALAQSQYTVIYKTKSNSVPGITLNSELMLAVQPFAKAINSSVIFDAAKKNAIFKRNNQTIKIPVLTQKNTAFSSLNDLALGLRLLVQISKTTIRLSDMQDMPNQTQDNVEPPVTPAPTPPAPTKPNASTSSQPKTYTGTFKFEFAGFQGHGNAVLTKDGDGSYHSVSGKITLDLIPDPFAQTCGQEYLIGAEITQQTPFSGIILLPMAGRYSINFDGIVCSGSADQSAGGLTIQIHSDPSPDSFGQRTNSYASLEGQTTYLGTTFSYSFSGQ